MKKLLTVVITLTSIMSYGQSKKEMNAAYLNELSKLKTSYDSLVNVYLTAEKQLEQSRKNVRAQLRGLDDQKRVFINESLFLETLKNKLTALEVDWKPMIPMEESRHFVAPSFEDVKREQQLYNEVFTYKVVYDTLQLEKMKIKTQNPLLGQLIGTYKAAAQINIPVIKNEQTMIRKLDSIGSVLSTAKIEYEKVNKYYEIKGYLLNDKLKELEQNYTSKGPKGFPEAYAKVFPDAFTPKKNQITNQSIEDNDKIATGPPPPVSSPVDYTDIVDIPAEYPGGYAALMKYLKDNLVYPERAKELGIEGKCFLKFVVEEDGSISDIKVARGVTDCKECDDEAIRLVKGMPKWIPGKNGTQAVKQWYNLPIKFKLD